MSFVKATVAAIAVAAVSATSAAARDPLMKRLSVRSPEIQDDLPQQVISDTIRLSNKIK